MYSRICTDADIDFLVELYSSTRYEEVKAFGWDSASATAFLKSQFDLRQRGYGIRFPNAEDRVILVGNVAVGRFLVDRSPSKIHLIDIAILPLYQGQGIAFKIIDGLKTEARANGCSVILKVDRTAAAAIRLYQKAGFKVTAESQLMLEMEWLPEGPLTPGSVTLRPVRQNDRALLIRIYEASREIELGMTNWGSEQRRVFSELQLEGQTRHYREYYPNAEHSMILSDDKEVGRLYVDRGENEIAILDITVLPEFRKYGIGSHLISELQREAGSSGRSVRVFVESFNPSQNLFAKLGFKVTAEEGINQKMEWHDNI